MRVITALRPSKKPKTWIEVDLDGEPWLKVDAEVVVRFGVKVGGHLDGAAMAAIEKQNAFVTARQRAIRYCLRQLRTQAEVSRRLEQEGVDRPAIERVAEELRQQGLIEDRQVVRRQARRGKQTKIGPLRIEAELTARGVAPELLDAGLQPLRDADWQQREAEALGRARLARLGGRPSHEQRRKVADYLLRRGFESPIVEDIVNRLVPEE